ncbi:MAG: hypothetical protein HP491_13260 [Nitrospira sp.]|nr:hypothetical protein [Nitrospira sp.]MBH0182730.1 hypothetical protein [Nitrospira sp.]MBH0184981.1 hypothetical protein [Nitrospira sp.]
MRLARLPRILLYLLPFTIIPAVAQALPPVTIVINGTTVPSGNCTDTGITTTCNIAGNYGNVTVTSYPSGMTAQVIAVDDALLPVLKLVNAKFSTTANALTVPVTFSVTPTAGRNGPKMRRKASGWLGRVESTSSPYTSSTNRGQFIVDGVVTSTSMTPNAESIDGIASGGDTAGSSKVVAGLAWPYGEIKLTTFTKNETMGSLTGSRTLKGEFSFYLPVANDFLRLTEVTVESINPADDSDLSSVGYTDIWDDDTGRCKCKGNNCKDKVSCTGKDCPKKNEKNPK